MNEAPLHGTVSSSAVKWNKRYKRLDAPLSDGRKHVSSSAPSANGPPSSHPHSQTQRHPIEPSYRLWTSVMPIVNVQRFSYQMCRYRFCSQYMNEATSCQLTLLRRCPKNRPTSSCLTLSFSIKSLLYTPPPAKYDATCWPSHKVFLGLSLAPPQKRPTSY